jgi:hypothetical protein
MKRALSADQIKLWQKLAVVPAMMLQERLMAQALNGVKHECLVCRGSGVVMKKAMDGPYEDECGRCRGRGWVKGAPDPRLVKLAHDAAVDIKDRTMGKATQSMQIAQAVKVVVGGVDLGRLPDAEPVEAEVEVEEDAGE